MRLVADDAVASWLDAIGAGSEDFDWDQGNRRKLTKHDVLPADVESMFRFPIVFAGRIVEPAHDEPRWLLLGRNTSGRRLALIFTRRRRLLRPISCRSMRREERKVYEDTIRQEDEARDA